MMLEGHSFVTMAVTLFACACALVCFGFLTPMEREDRFLSGQLIVVLHVLAFCMLLTGLTLLTCWS
jgi:membrane-bound metal-dependent hydrolase YbcI (DUF457 family)